MEDYFDILKEEIDNLYAQVDFFKLNEAKNLIVNAKNNKNRIHLTGIGKPSYVAKYVASLLSSTGTPAYFLDGTEAVHGSSGQVLPGDIVIAISNSGQTEELVYTIKTLMNNGSHIIGVSGNPKSWLAENSNVFLYAGVKKEGDTLNKPPRASILAEMIILQYLSIILQEEVNLDENTYYQWHPGGSLGKNILLEGKIS